MMKYLLMLLLACLAVVEFFHHRAAYRVSIEASQAATNDAAQRPREPAHPHHH